MASSTREKTWRFISPKAFTSDGTVTGEIKIADTRSFKVKQKVILESSTQERVELEVKEVLDYTTLYVGKKGAIELREDVSAFTVVDGATIRALKQPRPAIPDKEYERAVYAEEPTVAKRTVLVDELGCYIDSVEDGQGVRRLAVDALVEVDIDADIGSNIAISRHQNPIRVKAEVDFVAADLDTTAYTEIFTYTSTDDKTRLRRITVKADTFGTFRLKKEGDVEEYFKTSFSERNCKFIFLEDIDLANGEQISIEFVPERIRLTDYNFFMRVEGYLDTP